MESLGVIPKVDEPILWCAGIGDGVNEGELHICIDLKLLNGSVFQEVYPLPTVDDTLAQPSGAKFFSKLDTNSGFRQIPHSRKSRPLTTFITPFGRYWFNKMPFGISSAPEHFHKLGNVENPFRPLSDDKTKSPRDKLSFRCIVCHHLPSFGRVLLVL